MTILTIALYYTAIAAVLLAVVIVLGLVAHFLHGPLRRMERWMIRGWW